MDNGSASWEQVHRTLFPGGPVPASLINVTNAGANSGAGILGPGPMGRPPFGLQQNAAFTPPANSVQGGLSPPPLPANTPLRPDAPHRKDDNSYFAAPPPVPRDPKMLHHIKLFAAFVAKFGSENEALARTKQHARSELSFLYGGDPGSEASIGLNYYEWQKEVMLKVLEARKAVSEGKIPPDRLKSMQRELEQYLNGVQTLKDFRLEAIIGLPENGKLDWNKIALELGIPLPGEKRPPQQVEASEKEKKSKAAVRPEVEAGSDPPASRDPRKNGKNDRSRGPGPGRRDELDTSNDRRGRRDDPHTSDRRSRRDEPDSNDRRGRREDMDPRRHRSRSRSQERGGHRYRSRSPHRSPRRSRSPRRHGRSHSRSPHRHRDRLSPRRGTERKREGEERKDEKLSLIPERLALDPTLSNQHMLPPQQPPPHLQHHHLHHPPQLVPPQATIEPHQGFVPADNALGRYISVLESTVGVPGTAYSQVGVPFAPPTLSEIPVQQQQILLQQLQLSQMQNLNVGPPPPPPLPPPQLSSQQDVMPLPMVPPQHFMGLGSQAVELSNMFSQPNQQQQQNKEQVASVSEKYDFLRPASPSNDVEMEVASPPKADDTSEVVSSRNEGPNGSGNGKSLSGGTEGEGDKKQKDSNKEDESGEDNVQKGKSDKDSRALKVVRNTVAEFVKELLNPKWREGILSKDDFKVIAQKAVNKVVGNLQGSQIPKGTERVDRFMASSKEKITKLVQEYVDKHTKNAPPAATAAPSSAAPTATAAAAT